MFARMFEKILIKDILSYQYKGLSIFKVMLEDVFRGDFAYINIEYELELN